MKTLVMVALVALALALVAVAAVLTTDEIRPEIKETTIEAVLAATT